MKPQNRKERQKAFLKVIGLFVLSLVIALILGFSTMNVSKISEHSAKSELDKLKNNLEFQETVFAPNIGKSAELLTKVPTHKEQGENLQVLNQDIGALISTTKNGIPESEGWQTKMYTDILKTLSDLQIAYNQQFELKEELTDSEEADTELEKCKAENQQLQNQITTLKASLSNAGGGGADTKELQKELDDTKKRLKTCVLENRALKKEIQKLEN